jgi:ribose transport system ATP-binding protein
VTDAHVGGPSGAGTDAATGVALAAHGIEKSFGAVRACDGADLVARFGEVHALVGENGAGKSTLIKVLCGVLQPDAGTLSVRGEQTVLRSPEAARAAGIATVFQELTLLPHLTVAENLLLGDTPRGLLGLTRRREMPARAEALLARHGVDAIDPRELPVNLSVAQRQVLEIVRAVSRQPRILVLDEPTAALPRGEVEWLFGLVRDLRAQGVCVLFTSHRWQEVQALADRITVFRNGRAVATREELGEDEAVRLMTGRSIDRAYPPPPALPAAREPLLEVSGLSGAQISDVDLTVHRGEIVGLSGLAGQGQRELFLTLFGARRSTAGQVRVGGKVQRIRRPSDAIRAGLGIAMVPEDRKSEGLLLPRSVRDNLTLPVLGRVSTAGVVRPSAERALVTSMVDRLRIKTTQPNLTEVGNLSGGNQQKVLLGRWILAECDVLLLFDVTRGVDVATKHEIYDLVVDLARKGKGILLYSSDTEEVAHLCHRVLVLREGRVAAELDAEAEAGDIVAAAYRDTASVR